MHNFKVGEKLRLKDRVGGYQQEAFDYVIVYGDKDWEDWSYAIDTYPDDFEVVNGGSNAVHTEHTNPVTSLTEDELYNSYINALPIGAALKAVANEAIKRYILEQKNKENTK